MTETQAPSSTDVDELRRRHQELDRRISEEEQYPGFDDLRIREMKREKLRLREAIVAAERQGHSS